MTELQGFLALVAGLGMLSVAGTLAASLLRLRSPLEFVLAVYLVTSGWLVALVAVLSVPQLVTRSMVLAGAVAVLVLSLVVWQIAGGPRPPSLRPAFAALAVALRHPAVLVLGVAATAGTAYSVALALTP